tara:strand:+ start:8367 stop:9221 length:855 start_codon:yes stop_codon:yes gene_type:complete
MPFHSNTGGGGRPDRESKSDEEQQRKLQQREADRKQKERDRKAREQREKQAEQARLKAQADARAKAKADAEKKKKQVANQAKNTPTRSKPVVVKSGMTANQLGRQIQDPSDIQATIKAGDKFLTQQKQNNAVKTTTKSKMSPPLSKPKNPTKFTIKGGTIKGGTIYKDPITGSTLAGRDTRMSAITNPSSVKVVDSRSSPTQRVTLLQATPDMSQTKLFSTRQKITSNNAEVVNNLNNPQETKLDLLTKKPVQNTLLTELSKRRKKRQGSGFTGIMSQIRSLLG